jgi:hypothetical protein
MNFQVRPNNANIDEVGPLGMIDRHNFTEVSLESRFHGSKNIEPSGNTTLFAERDTETK